MYAASPTLRGDAAARQRGGVGLLLAFLSEETLAHQLAMRGLGTARASAEQLRCKTSRKLAPATRNE